MAASQIPTQAAYSRKVEEWYRKAAARFRLYRIHIEGDPDHKSLACPQCATKDANPQRAKLTYCEAGRELHGSFYEAIAQAWYLVAESRVRAGRKPRVFLGAFSWRAELQYFFDREFEMTPAQRRQKEAAATNIYQVGEVFGAHVRARPGRPHPSPDRGSAGRVPTPSR